jgi:hypothetical protein
VVLKEPKKELLLPLKRLLMVLLVGQSSKECVK